MADFYSGYNDARARNEKSTLADLQALTSVQGMQGHAQEQEAKARAMQRQESARASLATLGPDATSEQRLQAIMPHMNPEQVAPLLQSDITHKESNATRQQIEAHRILRQAQMDKTRIEENARKATTDAEKFHWKQQMDMLKAATEKQIADVRAGRFAYEVGTPIAPFDGQMPQQTAPGPMTPAGRAPLSSVGQPAPMPPQGGGAPIPPAPMGPQSSNNPGNLRPVGASTGFQQFASPQEGIAAADRNLESYGKQGVNTLAGIIGKWSPPNENDTPALIATAARKLGIAPNQSIDLSDPRQRHVVLGAIMQQENQVFGRTMQATAGGEPPVVAGESVLAPSDPSVTPTPRTAPLDNLDANDLRARAAAKFAAAKAPVPVVAGTADVAPAAPVAPKKLTIADAPEELSRRDKSRWLFENTKPKAEPLVPVKDEDGKVVYVPRSEAAGREVGSRTTDTNISKQIQALGKDLEKAGLPQMNAVLKNVENITPEIAAFVTGPQSIIPDRLVSKEARDARQDVAKLFNITLKDRSGAAVTNQELERLKKEFGQGLIKTPDQLVTAIGRAKQIVEAHERGIAASYGKPVLDAYLKNLGEVGGSTEQTDERRAAPRDGSKRTVVNF